MSRATRTKATRRRKGGAVARVVRGTGTAFIVLGLLVLYFVLYELVGTSIQTHAHQRALKAEFAELLDEPQHKSAAGFTITPPAATKSTVTGIAEIIIPKIGIDDIVVQGVTLYDLAYGPGHYPDSAPIGSQNGTAAIAGHRTGWGSPFIRLDELTTGDTITLKTQDATYTYRVTRGGVVVEPTDYWVIKGDPQSDAKGKLTLTTCTPKYTSRHRLIVWADLVNVAPRVA
jgi:sortase A